jgi:hypothetical protein
VFTPARAKAEYHAALRAARKTKVSKSQPSRRKAAEEAVKAMG